MSADVDVSDFELEVVEAVTKLPVEYNTPLSSQIVAALLYTEHEVRALVRALQDDMMRNAMLADEIEVWYDNFTSTHPGEYFEPELNPLLLIEPHDTAWEEVAMYLFRLEVEAETLLQQMQPHVK